MKVLLLEDHMFCAEMMCDLFKDRKIEIIHASNYNAGIKAWEKEEFDFAILDILLQNGRTGLEFYHQIMKESIPIFFLTGCIDDITLDQVNGYKVIQKNEEELEKLLSVLIKEFEETGKFIPNR